MSELASLTNGDGRPALAGMVLLAMAAAREEAFYLSDLLDFARPGYGPAVSGWAAARMGSMRDEGLVVMLEDRHGHPTWRITPRGEQIASGLPPIPRDHPRAMPPPARKSRPPTMVNRTTTSSTPITDGEARRRIRSVLSSGTSKPQQPKAPDNVSEPNRGREPGAPSESKHETGPASGSETMRLSEPISPIEPMARTEPSSSSEPDARKPEPGEKSEPKAKRRAPKKTSETARPRAPSRTIEPIGSRAPSQASELVLARIDALALAWASVSEHADDQAAGRIARDLFPAVCREVRDFITSKAEEATHA